MQKHARIDAAVRAPLKERRTNYRKRDIVEYGVSVGQFSLIAGLEYLQSREIDATTIKRVLLDTLEGGCKQAVAREPADRYRRRMLQASFGGNGVDLLDQIVDAAQLHNPVLVAHLLRNDRRREEHPRP